MELDGDLLILPGATVQVDQAMAEAQARWGCETGCRGKRLLPNFRIQVCAGGESWIRGQVKH